MRRTRSSLLATVVACAGMSLVLPPSAIAAEPGAVTVRVEGFGGQTLLPQTTVTTTETPVPVPGGTCPGTSAAGALYDAVHGDWLVRPENVGPELDGILGQDLPALEESGNYAYWLFVLNDQFASNGVCAQEVGPGADIVLVGQCYATGPLCPSDPSAPAHVLTATAPRSSVLLVGESVSETIGSLNTASFEAEPEPPAGTTLSAGTLSTPPGPGGVATLTFQTPGVYTLQAHAPESAPSDPFTVCVHAPGDGGCGTSSPSSAGAGGVLGTGSEAAPYRGPFALVSDLTSVREGALYAAAEAPRLLTGKISSHSRVSAVSLSLRRAHRGRCWAYNGVSGRFRRARCGVDSFFGVSTEAKFSYLLPSALRPGRYVLDVRATDVAGNTLALARGTSREVFHVR